MRFAKFIYNSYIFKDKDQTVESLYFRQTEVKRRDFYAF
jgi:hypothetical protein